MTRFNPEKNRKTPEQWSAKALDATKNNHLQWNVIGGLVLGALAASAASPLTGGLIVAYFLWDSWKKAGEIQRNQAAITEVGCVAQVLDGDDFADYSRQVGHVAVLEELRFATERNLALSTAAADFLENYSPVLSTSSNLMTTAKTLLGKAGLQVKVESSEEIYINPDDRFDIIASMTDRISNSFILGISGTGKGIVVSNALRAAKVKHPKLKTFYIDPKHDEKEQGYTAGVADVIKRYKCETEEPLIVVAWLEKCLEEFNEYAKANDANSERTLLILDEGTVLGLKSKIAKSTILLDRLSSLTSLGDSSGKNIWFIAQTPFVGGSGIDLSASSQLVTIALVSAENRGSLDQWKRSAMVKKLNNIDEYIEKSPVSRAVFFGKTAKWYPMSKLENYSGYDRDSRKSVEGAATIRQQLEAAFSKKKISEQPEQNIFLSQSAQLIFDWLQTNRKEQWVKYKGSDRDMSFIKFLSQNNIKGEDKEDAIFELLDAGKIEIADDDSTIKIIVE
ncbi:hypothetical protein PI95_034830 [Hassallia byssoidea VB512170]|uniref:Uncharacterized protein n=1 Tax=Hassallia byssoidea VB512170 TaxID=1304833 RepID=A0A846HLG9_9CYAN|nr:hypothetical protein [Hassalia byssoidea]NEU77493.1 hypothetical protein [Hassalia byssoidea VB512170]